MTVGNPRHVQIEACRAEPFGSLPPNVRCSVTRSATFDANDVYIACGYKTYDADGVLTYEAPDPTSIKVWE